jgi:hypothetical protein
MGLYRNVLGHSNLFHELIIKSQNRSLTPRIILGKKTTRTLRIQIIEQCNTRNDSCLSHKGSFHNSKYATGSFAVAYVWF